MIPQVAHSQVILLPQKDRVRIKNEIEQLV
jgi:hypothetical protein